MVKSISNPPNKKQVYIVKHVKWFLFGAPLGKKRRANHYAFIQSKAVYFLLCFLSQNVYACRLFDIIAVFFLAQRLV